MVTARDSTRMSARATIALMWVSNASPDVADPRVVDGMLPDGVTR